MKKTYIAPSSKVEMVEIETLMFETSQNMGSGDGKPGDNCEALPRTAGKGVEYGNLW